MSTATPTPEVFGKTDEPDAAALQLAAGIAVFCIGLYITAFGPGLPFLARDFDVSLGTTGLLITVIFGGSISASLCTSLWWDAHDPRLLSLCGLAALAGGLATIGFAPTWPVALAGDALAGVGDGLVVAAAHMVVASTARDVPKGYTRLNIWFAVGAMLGPLWSGVLFNANDGARPIIYGGLALAPVIPAAMLFFAKSVHVPPAATDPGRALRKTALFWVMGAVLWLYVGAEIGLGGWVSSYTAETFGSSVIVGAFVTSGYWGALLLGRLACARAINAGFAARSILLASLIGATITSAALAILTGSIFAGAAAATASGFFFGPIWPCVSSIATAEGNSSGTPAAVVTIGNAGGLFLPWLQGRILAGSSGQRGIALTTVLCALMLAAVAASLRRQDAPPP